MANTYTRLFIHVVIRTKRGFPYITSETEEELYAYIGGVIKNQGHIPIKINGVSDHIHILLVQNPTCTLSDLMREVKSESSRMINEKGWTRRRFRWQAGYGAFSCDHHSADVVVKYIEGQKRHHVRELTFREEYEKFLDDYDVNWDARYVED